MLSVSIVHDGGKNGGGVAKFNVRRAASAGHRHDGELATLHVSQVRRLVKAREEDGAAVRGQQEVLAVQRRQPRLHF